MKYSFFILGDFFLPCQLPPACCGYPSAPSLSSLPFPSCPLLLLSRHLFLLAHCFVLSLFLLHSVAFCNSATEKSHWYSSGRSRCSHEWNRHVQVCVCGTFSLASSSISLSLSSLMEPTISECLLTVFSMYRCPSSAPDTDTNTPIQTYDEEFCSQSSDYLSELWKKLESVEV